MSIENLITLSLALSVFSLLFAMIRSRHLVVFFWVCYSLSFFPLITILFGQDAEFWTSNVFSYNASSIEIYGLTMVWILSTIGIIFGLIFLRKLPKQKKISQTFTPESGLLNVPIENKSLISLSILAITTISVVFRFFFNNEIEAVFPGWDPFICVLIIFCWAVLLKNPNKKISIYLWIVTLGYVISQLLTGDRNFFAIAISLLLLWMVRNRISLITMLKIGFISFSFVAFGIIISMARMDIELAPEDFLLFLKFNSWNAIILPVLTMIGDEWNDGKLLLGKSYLDLILSIPPSPFFSLLGIEKPINVDNPANWFYVEGLGGMHAVGIALRNFGLLGVFMQALLFTLLLGYLENLAVKKITVLRIYLFLTVAITLMHTLWYGLIYMINAMVLFFVMVLLGHKFGTKIFKK